LFYSILPFFTESNRKMDNVRQIWVIFDQPFRSGEDKIWILDC
jgi:hypothetical protein